MPRIVTIKKYHFSDVSSNTLSPYLKHTFAFLKSQFYGISNKSNESNVKHFYKIDFGKWTAHLEQKKVRYKSSPIDLFCKIKQNRAYGMDADSTDPKTRKISTKGNN